MFKSMKQIFNHDSKDKEKTNYEMSIRVRQKKGKDEVRIRGATLRVKVVPRMSGFGNDYRLSVWLPNEKSFEMESVQKYPTWVEFVEKLIEAATGEKAKMGDEKIVLTEGGLPIKILETENDKTTTIHLNSAPDPLKVQTQPEMKEEPKKEEKKKEEKESRPKAIGYMGMCGGIG